MAPITPMKGSHVAGLGIQGDPNPRLMRLVRDDAAHGIRFHGKPLHHHVTVTGDRLNMEMSRPCLEAWDQETSEPRACDLHRTTHTAP